jgi:hypothetical protein
MELFAPKHALQLLIALLFLLAGKLSFSIPYWLCHQHKEGEPK